MTIKIKLHVLSVTEPDFFNSKKVCIIEQIIKTLKNYLSMNVLLLAFAPVLIIAVYIYYRDKYEHEPIVMLVRTFLLGALITVPIMFVENLLDDYWTNKFLADAHKLTNAAYVAFIVAAFTEEAFKYLAFFFIWRNKNFNELFDGIVYAVFISLGFASIENILYVFQHGTEVGLLRAFTAVPAHALFGVTMGYYFGTAKFYPKQRAGKLILAIIVPILLHGIYDFILMSENTYLLISFVPFIIFLWLIGFKRMKTHSENSVFREDTDSETESSDE